MTPRDEPTIAIHRRRERDGVPMDDRRLRREIDAGRYVRVAPGSFVERSAWLTLRPIDRHLLRVVEAADRARGPLLIAFAAAAAVWGIDRIGPWPATVDTLVARGGGGRSSGMFRRHTTNLAGIHTVAWRGHEVTTPAQTALDIARVSGMTDGVIALDQALWGRRAGGALSTSEECEGLLATGLVRRGDGRARRAAGFATSLADSVREGQSRVLIERLGFPTPQLQHRFVLPSGASAYTDFWFEEHDHGGEFDGVGKYIDPALLRGRTPEQALIEEKDRGDELRRMMSRLSRWRTPALEDPRLLYDILTADGLPSTRPRPPRGLRLS